MARVFRGDQVDSLQYAKCAGRDVFPMANGGGDNK